MIKIIFPFLTSWIDYPNNEDIAILIYFLGCEHNCLGCHNLIFQSSNSNIDNCKEINENIFYNHLLEKCKLEKTNKVILSGGDPLYKTNITFVKKILLTYNNQFDFCVYTGYEKEYIIEKELTGFKFIKCGKFNSKCKQKSEKTNDYIQFSSTNQKLYDGDMNLLSSKGIYFFKN